MKMIYKFLLSVAFVAMLNHSKVSAKQAIIPDSTKNILEKFEAVCKKMSDLKGDYTLAGSINVNDKTRPTEKQDMNFVCCKKGDDFYYELGNTITLNGSGYYLFVNRQSRQIFISKQKKLTYGFDIKQLTSIADGVKDEQYKLSSKVNGADQTITLINERHISCKQYAVTFDKQSLKIKRLFIRLSNPQDPLRTDNEQVIDVHIAKATSSANLAGYLKKDEIIKRIGTKWQPAAQFKGYQLTEL